jgi:hypothetical protein
MVPYKHYAALEIEEVLNEAEDSSLTENSSETSAEERTIARWEKSFPERLSALADRLEERAEKMGMKEARATYLSGKPLARLYRIVETLQELPVTVSRLAYSFSILLHPVRLGRMSLAL